MIVSGINVADFQPADSIDAEDEEDAALLRAMYDDATAYISSFSWSAPVSAAYLADGVGGIAAFFLFVFSEKIGGTDEALWVAVGDIPSAYFVTDEAKTAVDAMETYCSLMEDWADAVLEGKPLDDVFPIEAAPTRDNALGLKSRIGFIRREFIA